MIEEFSNEAMEVSATVIIIRSRRFLRLSCVCRGGENGSVWPFSRSSFLERVPKKNKLLSSFRAAGATAELQIDTEKHMDGRAMREKVLQTAAERAEGFEDDKKYRGMNNYIDYRAGFRKEHSIASEKGGGSHGPMRASANVRLTFIMDYKPDICKDYKETGYCGYGDGCKFMHDRGDYKQGWQLDKEWDLKEKLKKEAQAKLEKMERGLGEDGQELDIDEKEVCLSYVFCFHPSFFSVSLE